jgi:hypothetical protein
LSSLSPSSFHHCHFASICSLLLLPSSPTLAYILLPIFTIATFSRLLFPLSLILAIVTCSYLPIPTCFHHHHLFKYLFCSPTLLFTCLSFELALLA